MARHVLSCLRAVPAIQHVYVLAPHPLPDIDVSHLLDQGRGLNAELTAARSTFGNTPILVIHGDLPILEPSDICELLTAAESKGWAIAPDRHGAGTNALALLGTVTLAFSFGANSFSRHVTSVSDEPAVVRRPGLAHDIDTPGDLDALPVAINPSHDSSGPGSRGMSRHASNS